MYLFQRFEIGTFVVHPCMLPNTTYDIVQLSKVAYDLIWGVYGDKCRNNGYGIARIYYLISTFEMSVTYVTMFRQTNHG